MFKCNCCEKSSYFFVILIESGKTIRLCNDCFTTGLNEGLFTLDMIFDTNISFYKEKLKNKNEGGSSL